MKVEKCNDLIIIYIYDKKILSKSDEFILKKVLLDLSNYYNIDMNSSYNIKLYKNKYYGVILEIENLENSINEAVIIDLKVLNNTLFLYEVNDPLDFLDNEIYYYNDKYYINIKEKNIALIENSNIIYGLDVYKIIGKGIKILF